MWSGFNQRKFPRCSINVELNICFDDKVEYVAVQTENIGIGGLCFISDRQLDPFQNLSLKIRLSDTAMPIECNGRVSWIVKKCTLDAKRNTYDVGIEFVNINQCDVMRIEKIINQEERV